MSKPGSGSDGRSGCKARKMRASPPGFARRDRDWCGPVASGSGKADHPTLPNPQSGARRFRSCDRDPRRPAAAPPPRVALRAVDTEQVVIRAAERHHLASCRSLQTTGPEAPAIDPLSSRRLARTIGQRARTDGLPRLDAASVLDLCKCIMRKNNCGKSVRNRNISRKPNGLAA